MTYSAEFGSKKLTTSPFLNLLVSQGIKKGDVVSLLLPNSAEYVIAYFACFKIGALAGPVNSLLKPKEIEYVTSNSESKLLLINSQFLPLLGDEAAIPTSAKARASARA